MKESRDVIASAGGLLCVKRQTRKRKPELGRAGRSLLRSGRFPLQSERRELRRGFISTIRSWKTSRATRSSSRSRCCISTSARFRLSRRSKLTPEQAADRELVLGTIRSALLDLESIRGWETNPDHYSSTASNAVFVIMSRNFAPQDERLKSVIARERQMPKLFAAARANLKNPPRIYTEVALEQLPGIVSFFEKDVPLAFNGVKDRALLDQFHQANAAVIRELQSYETFLKNDLLPRSKGDFRLGAENYRKKLLYDEMVDIPLDRLLEIGYANLRQNQESFRETAKKIDPDEDAAADSGSRRRRIIPPRISCSTRSATRWAGCATTLRSTTS